jgi:tRNA-modifying protein YgfZ
MKVSPLRSLQRDADALLVMYGPHEADVQLVATFGEFELEYAAIRKACVLIDRPDRALIEVRGSDRLDFLNRMVTQELKGLTQGDVRRTFWLNRKGRIDADLTLIELGDRLLIDLDVHAVERTLTGLNAYIITEDVALTDATESTHRMSLHGPTSAALLEALAGVRDLAPDRAVTATIAGALVTIWRDDVTGEPGFELAMPAATAPAVFAALTDLGMDQPATGEENAGFTAHAAKATSRFRLRPSGWHAFNVARLEAGRALYNLDFGPTSLPHETGDETLADRVSFIKGCYLGQEVVARMHSRGHPKQKLVALWCESRVGLLPRTDDDGPRAALPVTGDPLKLDSGEVVGAVTSSAPSPMLGQRPMCLAMLKFDHAAPGTKLIITAEGQDIAAEVRPSLRFWQRS